MKTLYTYLAQCLAEGKIDHSLRARQLEGGAIEFYIHADGQDSDTPFFRVRPGLLDLAAVPVETLEPAGDQSPANPG